MPRFTPVSKFRLFASAIICIISLTALVWPAASLWKSFGQTRSVEASPNASSKQERPNILTKLLAPDSRAAFNHKGTSVLRSPMEATANLLVPTITAMMVDSLVNDLDVDGRADPGDTLQYTVTINNAGTDATGVKFTNDPQPNLAFDQATLNSSPIAFDDTAYTATGNVRITVNAAGGVLTNDIDPDSLDNTNLTASAGATSANGGNVVMSSNGSFTYDPPAGFTGTDTFTYTVRDRGIDNTPGNADDATGTGTVTFNVSGMIWFINDDDPTAGGDGRLSNPFNCLVGAGCFDAVAADDPGDNIFLSSGSYTGGLTLLANQRLIGEGATASLSTITGITPPTGSDALPGTNGTRPAVTTTAAATSALTVGSGNTLRGFNIGNTTAVDITGTSFGTLTISEMTLNGTGRLLNLTTGTLAATIDNLQATTAPGGAGVSLTGVGGTLTISGTTSITTAGGQGITISGSSVAANFGTSTTITDPVTQGILVGTSTGNISFGNTTVSDATDSVSLTNNSAGTRSFGTLTTTNGTGIGFLHSTGGGATTVSGATTITNPGGRGIDIQNSTTSISFAAVNIPGSGGTGVNLQSNSGSITFGDLDIAPDAAQRGFHALSNTGTLTTTSGVITSTTTGVPVEIVGVSAANRTPLAMVLESVNANGSANGIVLTSTSGTFAVNGTGTTAGSGGTIQNITNRGASFIDANGITLKNMNLTNVGTTNGADPTNANSTCGSLDNGLGGNLGCNAGIHLVNVVGATFDRVVLNIGAQQGVNGNNVTSFNMSNSSVTNFGDQTRENGIQFKNLVGTAGQPSTLSSTTVTGNESSQLLVVGNSGTLTSFAVTGGSFNSSVGPNGVDGITVKGDNTGVVNVSVSGATMSNNAADGFFSTGTNTATVNVTVTGCTIQNNGNSGVNITAVSGANSKFTVTNNPSISGHVGNSISANLGLPSTGTLQGTISGNTIVGSTAAAAGGAGIRVVSNGSGTLTAVVSNNSISNLGASQGAGIDMLARDGNSAHNTTVTGNTVVLAAGNPNNGIFMQSGAVDPPADSSPVCTDIGGSTAALRNSVTAPNAGSNAIRVRQRFATDMRIPGYPGPANDSTQVATYIAGRNTVVSGPVTAATQAPGSLHGGAACTQPVPRMAGPEYNASLNPQTDSATATQPATDSTLANELMKTAWQPSLLSGNALTTNTPATIQAQANAPAASSSDTNQIFFSHARKTAERLAINVQEDRRAAPQDDSRKGKRPDGQVVSQEGNQETKDTSTDGGPIVVGGVTGFTLPAGKTITITYRATIAMGVLPAFTQVSNQAKIEFLPNVAVLTDDPATGAANDSTITPIDHTTVVIASSANPAVFGQPITFTATMTGVPSRASDPPGTVQFRRDGVDIGGLIPVVVGAPNDNVSTAQFIVSDSAVGSHVITAEYSGGGSGATKYNANIGTLAVNQVVNKANSASAIITDTPDPSLTGQTVTVSFTVTAVGPGAGTPTGNVTVSDGVDSCTATAAVGNCSLTLSTAGARNLTATYVGDGNFNASPASPAATHTVTTTATWVGGTSTDWDTDSNWGTGRKPNLASHSANIPSAGVTNEPTISVADVTLTDLTVGAGRTLTLNLGRILTATGNTTLSGNLAGGGTSNLNNLTINNAAGVAIGGNANVSGVLTLTSGNTTVAGTLSVGGGGSITRAAGHIIGNLKKTFAAPGSFTYHVGTANGYSPLATTVTAGSGDLTVRANQGTVPPLNAATTLQRYWTLTEAGNLTANLTFTYNDPLDIAGNEAAYRIIRVEGGVPISLPNNCPTGPCVNPATNTAVINGVTNFSEWTIGEQFAPTANSADLSGRVTYANGRPMRGVTVSLLNVVTSEVVLTRTNAKGIYRFSDISTGADYIITPFKEGYDFNPQNIVVNHTGFRDNVDFVSPLPNKRVPNGDDPIQQAPGEVKQGSNPIPADFVPPAEPR